jgi:hypothetical protein
MVELESTGLVAEVAEAIQAAVPFLQKVHQAEHKAVFWVLMELLQVQTQVAVAVGNMLTQQIVQVAQVVQVMQQLVIGVNNGTTLRIS